MTRLAWLAGAMAAVALPVLASTAAGPASGEVTIRRDRWGVPHVFARRETDALYGAAYALAGDNLNGILKAYVAVNGDLARYFGKDFVEQDLNVRRWRILKEARRGFRRLPQEHQDLVRAFLAGLRAYMEDHPDRVPSWAPQLEPAHPIAAAHALAIWISVNQVRQGAADCQVVAGAAMSTRASAPHPLPASNQWVVMPSRTASGTAMHWADSHSPIDSERDEVRLRAGRFATSGIVPAGMFLPIIAHTDAIAWSFADGGPDVSDCYEILTLPGSDDIYRVDGSERRVIRESVSLEVREAASVAATFEYVRINGVLAPVVARIPGRIFAIATPYMHSAEAMTAQVIAMNQARSVDEFRQALALCGLFPENVMAADSRGNAYYARTGLVPRRPAGFDWQRPVSGNTSATAWLGYHPLADLIEVMNPNAGFMVNTNNAPDLVTPSGEVRASDYPAYVFNDVPGRNNDRGERALGLLGERSAVTVEELVAIGFDEYWPWTRKWQGVLRAALAGSDSAERSAEQQRVLNLLLAFDGIARHESAEALGYLRWRHAVSDLAAERKLEAEELARRVQSGATTPEDQSLMLEAAARVARHPEPGVTLGHRFRIGRGNVTWPLGGVSIQYDGIAEHTLRGLACKETPRGNATCVPTHGQRHPILTVLSTPVRALSLVPFGQSSDPASPHHSDQARLMSEKRLKPTLLEVADPRTDFVSEVVVSVRPWTQAAGQIR